MVKIKFINVCGWWCGLRPAFWYICTISLRSHVYLHAYTRKYIYRKNIWKMWENCEKFSQPHTRTFCSHSCECMFYPYFCWCAYLHMEKLRNKNSAFFMHSAFFFWQTRASSRIYLLVRLEKCESYVWKKKKFIKIIWIKKIPLILYVWVCNYAQITCFHNTDESGGMYKRRAKKKEEKLFLRHIW